MSPHLNRHGFYVTTASVVVLGAAVGALLYRRKLFQSHILKLSPVSIISSTEDWYLLAERIKAVCYERKVVGLDCEWRAQTQKGESNPVALLQLATDKDNCFLIRLNKIGHNIPSDLKTLLQDKSILKVGLAVNDDAMKLRRDYGLTVEGCLDLRHLVDRIPKYAKLERKGLKSLAENVLHIKLKKSPRVRLSDWQAEQLTTEQIEYAAEDAVISSALFCHLVSERQQSWFDQFLKKSLSPEQLQAAALQEVGHLVDHRYRASVTPPKKESGCGKPPFPGKHQSRAYSTRHTPLYHNCQLLAPDGEILCTCDSKKARWYVDHQLAVIVSEEPLVVRLCFEPSGRPILDNKYYTEEKENQCVVCGCREKLVRKIIVPHEYRKFFPKLMKNHLSHDVLLLCVQCHLMSNGRDGMLRQQLALECGAPLGSGPGAKCKEDPRLKQIQSASRALLYHGHELPAARKMVLECILKDFYQVTELTESLIHVAAEMETTYANEHFVNHGNKVVEYYSSHSGLLSLESLWRQHFLETMHPKCLPKLWSVNHNHQRLALQVADAKDKDLAISVFGSTDGNMNQLRQ